MHLQFSIFFFEKPDRKCLGIIELKEITRNTLSWNVISITIH